MLTMATVTPLLAFLRAMTPDQKKQFAQECGTTLLYLYQLGAQKRPNPTLTLAMALVDRSKVWGRKIMTKPLTLEDLLVGKTDEE